MNPLIRAKTFCLLAVVSAFGADAAANCANADRMVGLPVLDVCELALLPDDKAPRPIAIYGDVHFMDRTTIVVRDRAGVGQAAAVDIRKINPQDGARLAQQCSHAGCPEIVTGFVVHGKLHANESQAFNHDLQSSSPCGSDDQKSPLPRWRA